jgi:hypothetical protein
MQFLPPVSLPRLHGNTFLKITPAPETGVGV